MFERLEAIENRYEELNMRLADPSVVNDQEQYLKLMKEHSELTEIVEKFREHKKYKEALEDAKLMLDEKPDKELAEMIEAEIDDAREGIARTERELKILLMPKDPNDEKDVIVEIRAGAGGEEAALFAAVLLECIPITLKVRDGKRVLLIPTLQKSEDLRKSYLRLKVKVHTAA